MSIKIGSFVVYTATHIVIDDNGSESLETENTLCIVKGFNQFEFEVELYPMVTQTRGEKFGDFVSDDSLIVTNALDKITFVSVNEW